LIYNFLILIIQQNFPNSNRYLTSQHEYDILIYTSTGEAIMAPKKVIFVEPLTHFEITSDMAARLFRSRANAILAKNSPLTKFIQNLFDQNFISQDDRDQLLVWMEKTDLRLRISCSATELVQNELTTIGFQQIIDDELQDWHQMSEKELRDWGDHNLIVFRQRLCKHWPIEISNVRAINKMAAFTTRQHASNFFAPSMQIFFDALVICFLVARMQKAIELAEDVTAWAVELI